MITHGAISITYAIYHPPDIINILQAAIWSVVPSSTGMTPCTRLQNNQLRCCATLCSIYILMATTALDASLSTSLWMGQQVLLASPEHLQGSRRVSNVRHSSETAFLTMQHVNSTKLFAELNPMISTILRQLCCCSGSSPKCEEPPKNWFMLHIFMRHLRSHGIKLLDVSPCQKSASPGRTQRGTWWDPGGRLSACRWWSARRRPAQDRRW